MIKEILIGSLLMVTPVAADEIYSGLAVGGGGGKTTGGGFVGYSLESGDGMVYSGEVGGYAGQQDLFTLDGKVGVNLGGSVIVSTIGGYGHGTDYSGWRYGIGADWRVDDRYFVGTNLVFQHLGVVGTETRATARAGIRF